MARVTWRFANLTGQLFSLKWARRPGKPLTTSGGLYAWRNEAVPLRASTKDGVLSTAQDFLGVKFSDRLSLANGILRIGDYAVRDDTDGIAGRRMAAAWTNGNVGMWTDTEPHSTSWFVDLFEHLAPANVDGAAVATGARRNRWNPEESKVLNLTIAGLGLLVLNADGDALARRPRGRGFSVPAGELFKTKSPQGDPELVVVSDDVIGHLHLVEVAPDAALTALEGLESLTTRDAR